MRNVIRRMLGILLAAGLLLGLCGAGAETAADNGAPLSALYRAGEELLTGETSFTLRGEADFSLDGVDFKHAEGIYAQEGQNSYQQISLKTPRWGGEIRENGYAVADFGGEGYGIERWLGKTIIHLYRNEPKSHALRDTVASSTLLRLGRAVAEYLDLQTAGTVIDEKTAEGRSISLEWEEENIPALVNAGLNQFWQQAAEHFFFVNYQDMPAEGYAEVEDFLTVTGGLLYTTLELELSEAQLGATLDAEGHLTSLEGLVRVRVISRSGRTRMLEISGSLTGSDWGKTSVRDVIPEENRISGVPWDTASPDTAETSAGIDLGGKNAELAPIPLPTDTLTHRALSSEEDARSYAAEIAALDGLGIPDADRLVWTVEQVNLEQMEQEFKQGFEAVGAYDWEKDTPVLTLLFDDDGGVRRIVNHTTQLDRAAALYTLEDDTDAVLQWREEIEMMLWRFTENVNPGTTEFTPEEIRETRNLMGYGYTSYQDTMVSPDERFVVMFGELHRDPWDKVKFVVQTAPTVRVVLMDTTVDPLEGGQG